MTKETVNALVDALAEFLDRVGTEPRLTLAHRQEIEGVDAATLEAFGAETGRPLPPEVAEFFAQGFSTHASIDGEREFGFAMLDFQSLSAIRGQLAWWGDLDLAEQIEEEADEMEDPEGYRLQAAMLRTGIPLWQDEASVVADSATGKIVRYGAEGSPCDLIADSFGEFLRHFIGAGCFNYGAAKREHFQAYWEIIQPFAPFGIAPRENLWLRHLDRWYRGDITA